MSMAAPKFRVASHETVYNYLDERLGKVASVHNIKTHTTLSLDAVRKALAAMKKRGLVVQMPDTTVWHIKEES